MSQEDKNGNGLKRQREKWSLTRERTLMYAGLVCITSQVILSATGLTWDWRFVLAGLALCGVSITTWGDKKQ